MDDLYIAEFKLAIRAYIDESKLPHYVVAHVLSELHAEEQDSMKNDILKGIDARQNGGKHNIMEGDANGITE